MESAQKGNQGHPGQQSPPPGKDDWPTENHDSEVQHPLLIFSFMALNSLGLSEEQRTAVEDHLNSTTWPKMFLSIENARDTLANTGQTWSDEDDAVLMSLPAILMVPTWSENPYTALDAALFPGWLAQDCVDRRKYLMRLRMDGFQNNHTFSGEATAHFYEAVPNGQEVLSEMIQIRNLLIARKESLLSLREHGKIRPGTASRQASHQVSHNEVLKARELLNEHGWPGRYRNLQSFAATPSTSNTMPSDADADLLHILMSSTSSGITWDTVRKAFFPPVCDADWKRMISAAHGRRGWSRQETDELMSAYEMDELVQFATDHKRTVAEVTHKARNTFLRQPNQLADATTSMPGSSGGKPRPPYSVVKRTRPRRATKSDSDADAHTEENTTTATTGIVDQVTDQPETLHSEATTKHPPLVTDDMVYNVVQYYPADAYNIVRLRSASVSFEVLSHLKFKGTYSAQRIRDIYHGVSKEWGHIILTMPWQDFEKHFHESFAQSDLLRVPVADQRQSNLPSESGTNTDDTILLNQRSTLYRTTSPQIEQINYIAPPPHVRGNTTRKHTRSGNLPPVRNPPAPANDAPAIPSKPLDRDNNIYQHHTSPSNVVQSTQLPTPQHPTTLYDAYPTDYLSHDQPRTEPFRSPQPNYHALPYHGVSRSLVAPDQAVDDSLTGSMGRGAADGAGRPFATSVHPQDVGNAPARGYRPAFDRYAGAQDDATSDVEHDGPVTYRY